MKIYISYKDEDDKLIKGFFELLNANDRFVILKSNQNILWIPIHRVLKIKFKENLKGGNK